MTKLTLKSASMKIKYEGDDRFLKTNLMEIQTAFRKSENEAVKRELLQLHEEVEQNFIVLSAIFASASKLNDELFSAIEESNSKSIKYIEEIKASADRGEASTALFDAVRQMQEMQMSFNLQYLMLQNKISHENRQFTMVSNIMKNKHDTAKNSINNIR